MISRAAAYGAIVVVALVSCASYGVRRYLASAEPSEARNTIGAIAREVAAHWEETGVLCPSIELPPAGAVDAHTEVVHGRCPPSISITQPLYYRYRYTSGYGAAATPIWIKAGGRAPTGLAFEVSAVAADGTAVVRVAEIMDGTLVLGTEVRETDGIAP